MINTTTVQGVDGRYFTVRVVFHGDAYGLRDGLTYDKAEPMVEFYDRSVNLGTFGPRGQFVSRYNLSTLAATARRQHGLALMGAHFVAGTLKAWSLPHLAVDTAVAFAMASRPPAHPVSPR